MSFEVELMATRAALAPTGGVTHLRVTVTPPEAPVKDTAMPVALVVVADRSGSMNEPAGPASTPPVLPQPTMRFAAHQPRPAILRPQPPVSGGSNEHRTKMSVTRDAAERLVDAMRDGDHLGIISFSDVAQVDLPLAPLRGQARTTARDAIRRLQPDSMTNLHDGLRLAIEQFDATILSTHVCKILVITDGLANVGITSVDGLASLIQPAAVSGITCTTIGVGLEYSSAILAALARAGGGDYYHIETAVGVDVLLQRELAASSAVTVRGVEVAISAGKAAIGANLNGYAQAPRDGGVRVLLGDLARPCTFWLELTSPLPLESDVVVEAMAKGTASDDVPERSAATLVVRVTSDVTAVPENAALVVELADLIRARGLGSAAELYDSGDVAGGQVAAQRSMRSLQALGAVYSAAPLAIDGDLQSFAAAPAPSQTAGDRRRLKQIAARAYAAGRGRRPDDESNETPDAV